MIMCVMCNAHCFLCIFLVYYLLNRGSLWQEGQYHLPLGGQQILRHENGTINFDGTMLTVA